MDQRQQPRVKKWRGSTKVCLKQLNELLVMGDFNAKVGRMPSAVGLYGVEETNEAGEQLEDFYLEHDIALTNTMFKQHPRRLYMDLS